MDKHVELGILLDTYGVLLTQRQRSLMEQSVYEDCSLAEIAEREGISRQGVSDALRRASQELYDLEQKLKTVKKITELRNGLMSLKDKFDTEGKTTDDIQRLIDICEG